MRLQAGQLVRLNKNIDSFKEGELFNVIRVSGALAVLKNTITKDEYFVYRDFDGADLAEKGVFYV